MENRTAVTSEVTLVGHPFAPIGMGELPRLIFRALRAVGVKVGLRDVYGISRLEPDLQAEFAESVVQEFSSAINIFCLNGDEVEPALRHLSTQLPRDAFNVVYPFWELSKYPAVWAEQLDKFDEVWTASTFIQQSIAPAVIKPVLHVSAPGEIKLKSFLGRRYFGIPESSFVFLFFFDFTSYLERKNPFAALRAFDELCKRRPKDDLYLVLKIKGGEEKKKSDRDRFYEYVDRYKSRLLVIDKLLTDNEVKNLACCCDCFLSLHRSEGFGFGLTTAMYLGKPVVATAYSGNVDFMTEENSCPVRYSLCEVPHWAYPFAEGQVWADPDIGHAVDHMVRLVSERDYALKIGENASRHMRVNFSYQAAGLRYADRIRQILAGRAHGPSALPHVGNYMKNLQSTWDRYGKTDPLYYILSLPEKKDYKWDPEDFYETGKREIEKTLADLVRFDMHPTFSKALDFGCGVGRLTQALAEHFEECHGIDISPSMIERARQSNRFGARCEYHLNSSADLRLFKNEEFDLIYSNIALQHVHPACSKLYLAEFVRVLRPGGIAVFQLPSEPVDPKVRRQYEAIANQEPRPVSVMEMHGVPRDEVIQVIKSSGGQVERVEQDRSAGEEWISFRYFVSKPGTKLLDSSPDLRVLKADVLGYVDSDQQSPHSSS